LESPPKTNPPPVATSDIVNASWEWVHTVSPVSAEIAWIVPSLASPRLAGCRQLATYEPPVVRLRLW